MYASDISRLGNGAVLFSFVIESVFEGGF